MMLDLTVIQASSLWIVFLLMVIEGPIVTAIAAFAAYKGFFNITTIFLLSLIGNFFPDIFFYYLGRYSRKTEQMLYRTGFDKQKLISLEKSMKRHTYKTIITSKITPFMPIIGLMLAGFLKVPFKKFIKVIAIYNILSSTIFVFAGYYFGLAIDNIFRYVELGQYFILFVLILAGIIYLFNRYLTKKVKEFT